MCNPLCRFRTYLLGVLFVGGEWGFLPGVRVSTVLPVLLHFPKLKKLDIRRSTFEVTSLVIAELC